MLRLKFLLFHFIHPRRPTFLYEGEASTDDEGGQQKSERQEKCFKSKSSGAIVIFARLWINISGVALNDPRNGALLGHSTQLLRH